MVRQKPQAAEINAEDGHFALAGAAGYAEQRAVAAQHDDQIRALHDFDFAPSAREA
jgi:hypothetical protein